MKNSLSNTNAFCTGMISSFDFFGTLNEYDLKESLENPVRADMIAFRGDRNVISNDWNRAISQLTGTLHDK